MRTADKREADVLAGVVILALKLLFNSMGMSLMSMRDDLAA